MPTLETRVRNRVCLYFAPIAWGHTWQRPQELAARLASRLAVLYVEPLGLRRPRPSDVLRLRPGPGAHADGNVERVPRGACTLPWPGIDWIERLNGRLLARRLGRRLAGRRPAFAWLGVPSRAASMALERWPDLPIVYDALDDFAAFHGGDAYIAETQTSLARRARLVLATSAALEQRLRVFNPAIFRLPNGADVDRFAAGHAEPEPPELRGLPRPIAGYCGELGAWFDAELVARLARARPQVSFVLLGPMAPGFGRSLRGLHNVHLLGARSHAQAPRYVARFDVALLPFRLNALTLAVNPIKLYEYLASGAPLVSTALPEVLPFAERGLVRVAQDADFGNALDDALDEHDEQRRAARREEARKHTWDLRSARLMELLAAAGLLPAEGS